MAEYLTCNFSTQQQPTVEIQVDGPSMQQLKASNNWVWFSNHGEMEKLTKINVVELPRNGLSGDELRDNVRQ